MRYQAVEHNSGCFFRAFLCCTLAVNASCYAETSTTSNRNESNVSLLTTAVMVDNLAKKVDECPLNRDR